MLCWVFIKPSYESGSSTTKLHSPLLYYSQVLLNMMILVISVRLLIRYSKDVTGDSRKKNSFHCCRPDYPAEQLHQTVKHLVTWSVDILHFCLISACVDSALTLQHPLVSCWRCVSRAWRRWEPFLMIPTSTCCTWCTRPWVFVVAWKIYMELSDTERRSLNLTGAVNSDLSKIHISLCTL